MADSFRKHLARYGYNYCPENYKTGNVDEADDFLLLADEAASVRAATRAYQEMFRADLDRLTMRRVERGGYQRLSIPDGIAGKCTKEVSGYARCGMPDYVSRSSEAMDVSIPPACRQQITISYDPGMRLNGIEQAKHDELFVGAAQNIANAMEVDFTLIANYPNTMVHSKRANLSASVLANMELWWGDCSASVGGNIDHREWSWWYLLTVLSHEYIHSLGAGHSNVNGALSFPSISSASVDRKGALIEADKKLLEAIGYKRRTAGPPLPPPKPNGVYIDGISTVKDMDGNPLGKFIFQPHEDA